MIIDFFEFDKARTGKQREERMSETVEPTEDYLDFGYDYFDNPDLGVGYGGYKYDGRYRNPAAKMIKHYGLVKGDYVLETGCAKGFVLVHFYYFGMNVFGVDHSLYAVGETHPEIFGKIAWGNAWSLPSVTGEWDLVFSKEMLPHIPEDKLDLTLKEMIRVSKGNIFLEIQCGRTPTELERMKKWDVTHRICQTPEWWNERLDSVGYPGDVHYKVLFPDV